jgi:hypothetical protein
MDNANAPAELPIQVTEVQIGTARFDAMLGLAARVLGQDRHLTSDLPAAQESHVLGAFDDSRCVGFLRYLRHRERESEHGARIQAAGRHPAGGRRRS